MSTTTPPAAASRSRFMVALTIAAFLGGVARVWLAAQRPMWEDEIARWTWSHGCEATPRADVTGPMLCHNRAPADPGTVLQVVLEKEQVVMPLLTNVWLHVSGVSSDFGGRMPIVLFGVLTIVATATLGRMLVGDRGGLAAGAIVAASPLWIYYGAEFNNYALAGCLVAFSYVFYFRWLAAPRAADGVAYAVCILGACLTHYYALAVLGAQALASPVAAGRSGRRMVGIAMPFLAVAGCLAAYAPIAARQVAHMGSMTAGDFGGLPLLLARLRAMPVTPWLWQLSDRLPGVVVGLVAVAVVGLYVWGLAAMPSARVRLVVAINTIAPVLALVGAYWATGRNQLLWARYGLFFTIVPIVVIAGVLAARPVHAGRVVAAAGVAVMLASGVTFLFAGTWERDWRGAARLIADRSRPNDVVFVHYPNLIYTLGRYLPAPLRLFPIGADGLDAQLDQGLVGRSGAWAVFAWDEGDGVRERVDTVLGCRFGRRDRFPLYQIEVVRYRDAADVRPPVRSDCGPRNGFVADDCTIAPDGTLEVRGWVAASPDAHLELLVDGVAAGTARPGPAIDGVDASPSVRWFAAAVPDAAIPEGHLARVAVAVREPGAPPIVARHGLECLRRSRVAMTGTRNRSFRGLLGAPGNRRRFASGDPIAVDGWAFSGKGIVAIAFLVDGVEVARTRQHGFARGDVAASYPRVNATLALHSGFRARIDTTGMAAGKHRLRAMAVHPDGSQSPLSESRRFEIVAPASNPPQTLSWRAAIGGYASAR